MVAAFVAVVIAVVIVKLKSAKRKPVQTISESFREISL